MIQDDIVVQLLDAGLNRERQLLLELQSIAQQMYLQDLRQRECFDMMLLCSE